MTLFLSGQDQPEPPLGRAVLVQRVVDGDTIVATDLEGKDLDRVRLVGIDASEMDTQGLLGT